MEHCTPKARRARISIDPESRDDCVARLENDLKQENIIVNKKLDEPCEKKLKLLQDLPRRGTLVNISADLPNKVSIPKHIPTYNSVNSKTVTVKQNQMNVLVRTLKNQSKKSRRNRDSISVTVPRDNGPPSPKCFSPIRTDPKLSLYSPRLQARRVSTPPPEAISSATARFDDYPTSPISNSGGRNDDDTHEETETRDPDENTS